jgi:ribosomal protein S6
MEPAGVAELERNLGLTEQVMRHLIVRLEDGETVGEEEPEEQAVESSEPAAE